MAQLFLLYVNTKSAWWWLTYSLFEIAGRSQRRAFLKTTVILKPQKGLWHPQSCPCVTNSTWHLHQPIACLEDCIVSGNLGGSLWVLMKMTNVVIWLLLWGRENPKLWVQHLNESRNVIQNVTVRPTPIPHLPIRPSPFLVAEFVLCSWIWLLIRIVVTA